MNISLYIHIPFCKQKCLYCDFYSNEYNEKIFSEYLQAIIKEWELINKNFIKEKLKVETVFLGGGTPSILSPQDIKLLNSEFLQNIPFTNNIEFTIECNPESFTEEKCQCWLDTGINRLSIGVQSLNDNELKKLGRIHNSRTVLDIFNNPILNEFKSINADIMFGIPEQTINSLNSTLNTLLSIKIITHLSIYELTLAEDTSFFKNLHNLKLPKDDQITKMNNFIIKTLTDNDFIQYEISNFSKSGFECQHNKNYWEYKPYIGLGPSAHSFLNTLRYGNYKNTDNYIKSIQHEKLPHEFFENLTTKDKISELIFLGLRTKKGINISQFENITKSKFENENRLKKLLEFKNEGFLIKENYFWKPTQKGILFADKLASELI